MTARCRAIRSARTSRLVATELTAPETSGSLMAAVTSCPLIAIVGSSGSVTTSSRALARSCATAMVSDSSTPSRSASQVTARYIAPVSRKARPSRRATARAVLDFPDPLGPSIATTSGRHPRLAAPTVNPSDTSHTLPAGPDAASRTRDGPGGPGPLGNLPARRVRVSQSWVAGSQATCQPRLAIAASNPSARSGATESAR